MNAVDMLLMFQSVGMLRGGASETSSGFYSGEFGRKQEALLGTTGGSDMDSVSYLRQFESCDDIGNGDFSRICQIADEYAALQAENERLTEELRKVNAGETVSVRFDLSPAAKEGAVRDQLVAMGWAPPGHLETMSPEGAACPTLALALIGAHKGE